MTVHTRADNAPGAAQNQRGIGITSFIVALLVAVLVFVFQISFFLCMRKRHKLRYIYNPKSDKGPPKTRRLPKSVIDFKDQEIIKHGGLDAYYFLRYLKFLVHLFIPILCVVVPILIPLNYVDGRGRNLDPTSKESSAEGQVQVMGLDTLAFGNVRSSNTRRYAAHLVCALLVTVWFCYKSSAVLYEYEKERCIKIPDLNTALKDQRDLVNSVDATAGKWLHSSLKRRNEKREEFESAAIELIRSEGSSDLETKVQECWEKFRHSNEAVQRSKLQSIYEKRADSDDMRAQASSNATWIRRLFTKSVTASKKSSLPNYRGLNIKLFPPIHSTNLCDVEGCETCKSVKSAWDNVMWANFDLDWWWDSLRRMFVAVALVVMIVGWALPVSGTAALSQVDNLVRSDGLRSFFQRHENWRKLAVSVAGVLPGVALTIMHLCLPWVLESLSRTNGAKFKVQQAAFVQRYYFVFLFVQMFLVVSIASFFSASLKEYWHNIQALQSTGSILNLLSQNLPTAANYFFSFMILQALTGFSSIMMQLGQIFWFFVDKFWTYTPRQKWSRGVSMDIVAWGAAFPLYTTLACISLIYSVIAPLISLFAIISFGMLWLAHRYAVIYFKRLESDHAGVLYPRAINQTYTGIYVMQLCISGLFFGVRDDMRRQTCLPHGIIMIVSMILTAVFQVAFNTFFLPAVERKLHNNHSVKPSPANDNFLRHLTLVYKTEKPWIPNPERLRGLKLGDAAELVTDISDQNWRAVLDEGLRVQILKEPSRGRWNEQNP